MNSLMIHPDVDNYIDQILWKLRVRDIAKDCVRYFELKYDYVFMWSMNRECYMERVYSNFRFSHENSSSSYFSKKQSELLARIQSYIQENEKIDGYNHFKHAFKTRKHELRL